MTRTERAALAGKALYDHLIIVFPSDPHRPPIFMADVRLWVELGRALYGDDNPKVRELMRLLK